MEVFRILKERNIGDPCIIKPLNKRNKQMNTIKLKDMSIAEQKALVWASHIGTPMEYWNNTSEEWRESIFRNLSANVPYRITPEKPSINWEHVGDRWNFIARDLCGRLYLYTKRPFMIDGPFGYWEEEDTTAENYQSITEDTYASYESGDVDWKDSLIQR